MEQIDNEALIARVKERPVLWDKTLDSYKNKVLRDAAWREIFVLLNEEYQEMSTLEREQYGKQVVKKWTQMRDNWIKSVRKHHEKKRYGRLTRLYIYHKHMSFLKKVASHLTSAGENNTGRDKVREKRNSSEATSSGVENVVVKASTSGTHQKRKLEDAIPLTEVKEYSGSKSKVVKYDNESHHLSFFKGLLPSLSSLNDDQTLEFQAGVISLLQGIKRNAQITTEAYQFNHFLAQPMREVNFQQNGDQFIQPRPVAESAPTAESQQMSPENRSIKSEHSNLSATSHDSDLNFDFV